MIEFYKILKSQWPVPFTMHKCALRLVETFWLAETFLITAPLETRELLIF